jgi:hypothetical protein
MDPSRDRFGSRRSASLRTRAGLLAGVLLAFAVPAGASWTLGQVGSWMIVERWDHGLGPKKVTRVTTTLLNRDGRHFWFGHVDDHGQRWEDADSLSINAWTGGWAGGGHDTVMGRDSLSVDEKWIACRVILNEKRSKPFSASDPMKDWVSHSKRWEAIDTTLRLRVLKSVDLGTEFHYRDGRAEKRIGRFSQVVKALHEKVRIRGKSYDCWVQEWKSLDEKGEYSGRTTVWGCETTPAGWVRQVSETRVPDQSGVTRSQQQLVDYKFN